jgi:hypothetical protein
MDCRKITETIGSSQYMAAPEPDWTLTAAVFGATQLADLTIAVGLMKAYNRTAIGFRAPPAAFR